MRRKYLSGLLSTLLLLPSAHVASEPVKSVKIKHSLKTSLNDRLRNNPTDSTSRIYKHIPFEPLTDNQLSRQSKNHFVGVNKGEKWIEIIIQKDDTLYSVVKNNGLSIKDLYVITHLGSDSAALKNLRPGQKIRIHASDKNILEIIQQQTTTRQLHVKKSDGNYIAITTQNGMKIDANDQKYTSTVAHSNSFPQLTKRSDAALQTRLEKTINNLGLMDEIRKKKLAVALVDITNLEKPRLASLNGNEMMYAASLPKIAILLGAFVEIERGNMKLDDETRDALTQMIRFSSNEFATKMLHKVGNQRLQDILMSDRFKLYDPQKNGGLWVGKEYGKHPAFERDPLHNLSHGATVLQAARFYYLLETNQLVSAELTSEMKEILSHPMINHKFVKGLAGRPEATIYRKSGTWRQWHADSALVEANGYKYIAVALAEDPSGGQWLADLITPMHDLIVPPTYAHYTPR